MVSIKAAADLRKEDILVVTEFVKARKRGLVEEEAKAEAVTALYREILKSRKHNAKRRLVEPDAEGKIALYDRIIERIGEIFYVNVLRPEIRKYIDRDIDFVDFADTVRTKFNRCC